MPRIQLLSCTSVSHIFSGEAVFTTSRHKPGTKSVWPVVQSTEINCGRASATAPGPAGPGPNDSLNILVVLTVVTQS